MTSEKSTIQHTKSQQANDITQQESTPNHAFVVDQSRGPRSSDEEQCQPPKKWDRPDLGGYEVRGNKHGGKK